MQKYEQLICAILRGGVVSWPDDPGIGAEQFYRVSYEHGVTALVYYRLVKSGSADSWPGGLVNKLQHDSLQLSAVELLRSNELQRIVDLFNKEGIVPILIKGAALSLTHYPEPGLRQRCDTDLFISADAIETVQKIMMNCGYSIEYPLLKSHQFSCCKKDDSDSPHCFDIHWRISNTSRYARLIGYEEAAAGSVPIPQVHGARVLGSIHALVLACVHLQSTRPDNGERLRWLYDIHLLVSAMAGDELLRFAQFAVDRKVQNACLHAVVQSRVRFHTEMPCEVEELLSTPLDRVVFFERFRQSNLGVYLNDLVILPGMGLKGRFAGELICPSPGYLLRQYGKTSILWIPWLYIRHLIGGAVKRFLLR